MKGMLRAGANAALVRGWTDAEQDILYCVVTRLEIGSVRAVVGEFDDAAFVLVHPLADAAGGVLKRPALH